MKTVHQLLDAKGRDVWTIDPGATVYDAIHLMAEKEVADLLGIPFDEVMQTAMTPLAYTIGTDFKPAKGREVGDILHVDAW